MFAAFIFLVFLIPFCLASANAAEPYSLASFIFLVMLVTFSALWAVFRSFSLEKLRPLRSPLSLTLFFLGTAVVCSLRQLASPEEIQKYFTGFLLFAIAISLSPKEKNKLISGILVAAFCISLMAIYQYFFGFQLLMNYIQKMNINDPFVMEKISQQRVFYPFPAPGVLAGYLAMTLPLLLGLKRGRLLLLLLLPFALALLLTRSLGALISLTLVSTILLIAESHSKKKKFLIPLILGAILVGLFLVRTRTHPMHLLPTYSVEQRLYYWRGAWDIIRAHPWVGTGLGSFDLPGDSFYAHNILLQLWAEAGIGSVLAFCWLVAAILRKSWKHLQESAEKKMHLGLFAGVCVFLVYNLTDLTFFLPATSFLWWIMMGLLFSTTSEEVSKSGENISLT